MENNGNYEFVEFTSLEELFLDALSWLPEPFPYEVCSAVTEDPDMQFKDAIRGGQGAKKAKVADHHDGWVMQRDVQNHLLSYWNRKKTIAAKQ